MEPDKLVWTVGLLVIAFTFEVAYGIECFACSTSDPHCKRHQMNDGEAPTKTGCDYCVVLYANTPKDYVLRSCRRDASGYYTTEECKDTTFKGEKRCFCMTDKCNGEKMDDKLRDLESGGGGGEDNKGSGSNTGPASSAVTWKLSGLLLFGLMLVRKCFIL